MKKIKGKVWKFGENINTDEIIPARYLNTDDPKELASHCMEDADPEFIKKYSQGDIIVAGKNFGSGSSREHAPLSIKAAGIASVVADSFARIFYRNAINIGLPILSIAGISEKVDQGDELEIDFANGEVKNITKNQTYKADPFPEFMQQIINSGGLMSYIMQEGQ
ncbi:MAG: 3-isopropylmalate dehydratase small subunit [Spirochaetes bacterium]|nr:3-isopropylmalate dehydratase small subunit [Spirochaetota bacterium]